MDKDSQRIDNVRIMAEEHKKQAQRNRQKIEDRKKYNPRDTNVQLKFAKRDLPKDSILNLPQAPPAAQVAEKDLERATQIDYQDDPLQRQKNFMFPQRKQQERSINKQMKNKFGSGLMFGNTSKNEKNNDPFKLESDSDEDQSQEEIKQQQGPVLFDNDSEPPDIKDPKQYVYKKHPPANMTPEETYHRCVMRLVSLSVPDPDYWSVVGMSNEETAEAMQRSGASSLEPIVYTQIQKHVMRRFLRHMKEQEKIKQNIEYFKTIPGLLQYCFDQRLCYPVKPLKILMDNQRKEFCQIFKDWYDCDQTLVFNQKEQQQFRSSRKQYVDKNLEKKLRSVTGSEQQASKLVEIAQNDFKAAMELYLRGQNPEMLQQTQLLFLTDWQRQNIGNLAPWQEQMFLYRFWRKYQCYNLRLRLQSEHSFLEIFTLSMTHLCPPLQKLIVKNIPYIKKLSQTYPPERIKPKRLPKKLKQYKYIRIMQI